MPRDANGTYTLPAGNPVVSGTTITANWANATMPDIGNEITDSLSRSGQGGMLVPFRLADGTEIEPAFSFTQEISLGMYRVSAGILGFAAGSALRATISSDLDGAQDVFTNAKLAGYQADGFHAVAPVDLNTIQTNSIYITDNNPINAPSDFVNANRGFIHTLKRINSSGTQILYGRNEANSGKIWMRGYVAGVWEAWVKIVDGGAFTQRLAGYEDNGLTIEFTGDVDDILVNSQYRVLEGVATNLPPDIGSNVSAIITTMMHINDTFAVQVLYGMNSFALYKQWQRSREANVWGAWKLVVDGNLAPPMQTMYGEIDGTTAAITATNGGISAVRQSQGNYLCTFDTPQANGNYNVQGIVAQGALGAIRVTNTQAASFTIQSVSDVGSQADRDIMYLFTRQVGL